ncbi:Uncharacterized protein HII31_02471 [Pseudocercospora fuligena]|uniref:Flavin reductase like domain-containing protein n=1 Tax=Pseudocercospora fuligena TaxID=685502 RepID=A0A8H6VRC2_9PEZI|nr:Uncharacterized protein HII31_02471 [Pseudocercospora fuligena]
MHRPGEASRRFYRAFYKWSLVNDPYAAGTAGVRACRHDFHTSAPTRAGQDDIATRTAPLGDKTGNTNNGDRSAGDRKLPIRFHGRSSSSRHLARERIASRHDGTTKLPTEKNSSSNKANNHEIQRKRYGDCPKKFITGEICSATAKPFNTLQSGDTVVRYRSDLGLMIEYAVRSDHLERLLKECGPNLNTLSKKHGARIEVQNLSAAVSPADAGGAAGLRTVSVLISGSFAEVGALYNHLRGRESVGLLSVGHGLVKSVLQRPSHTLRPLEYVLRHKSGATWTLEMSLLESHFMRFVAAHDTTSIAAQHKVSIDVGEPEQRRTSEVSDKTDAARSLVITGSPQDVSNAFSTIKGKLSLLLNAFSKRVDLPSNEQRDRAVKSLQPSKHIDGDSKATAKNTPERPASSADEALLVTVEGPSQANIIRNFIGTGLELEELRKDLGLQVLQPQRVRGDIGLLVKGTHAANRIKDRLRGFIKATRNDAGYAEHSVEIKSASGEIQTSARPLSAEGKAKLSEDIRMISRALSHPVVHISAKDPLAERHGVLGKARGLTISSFNTITLAPEPIISFNIKVPSRTWDAIYASQKLRVSILAATTRGAAIAHAFTQPYEQPSEPFEKLLNARVTTLMHNKSKKSPPIIWDNVGGGILASMQAHLLPDKCVQVGDHVVVVAKVDALTHSSKSANEMALSYAAQSYRSAGEAIEPAELSWSALQSEDPVQSEAIQQEDVEDELDPLNLGSYVGSEHHGQAEGHTSSQSVPYEALSSPPEQNGQDFSKDPLYHALRLTSDASKGDKDVDIYQEFSKFSEPADQDSETPEPERDQQPRKVKQQEDDEERAAAARAEEDEYDFGFDRPRHARNDSFGTSKRPYSTSAALPPFNTKRFYSTTSKATDVSSILDPTTSQTTLSDYLCLPDDRRPYTPRVRGLIKRKSEIDTARTRLTSDEELLEASEISELENLISTNERIIAKRLAWNATVDLRFMLDKGRYDTWFFSRVGWFESTIEKGQAVLLEEAKVLKRMFEEGKVGREKYDVLAEKLKGDFEVLSTETRRLARVFEENGEMGDD